MGPVSRASLVAEDRLGLWSSALTDSPGVAEPRQPSRAVHMRGWYSPGAAVFRVEREVERARCPSCYCRCPVCPCRAVLVSGGDWRLSWGQDGTSGSSHPHSPSPSSASDHGLWLLAAPWTGRLCKAPTPWLKVS